MRCQLAGKNLSTLVRSGMWNDFLVRTMYHCYIHRTRLLAGNAPLDSYTTFAKNFRDMLQDHDLPTQWMLIHETLLRDAYFLTVVDFARALNELRKVSLS